MTILHIASFRFVADVAETDIVALTDALHQMRTGIPEIRSYVAGPNLHLRAGGADYAVAAVLDDAAGLDAYLDHPDHKAVYEQYLGWMISERSAAQLPLAAGSFEG